jgi:hypothetical protein
VDTVIVHLAVRNETNLYVIEHEKRNNKKQRSIIYDAAAQRRAAPRRAPSFVSGGLLLSHLWRFGDAVLSEHRGSYKSVHEGWPGPCRPAHNTPKGVRAGARCDQLYGPIGSRISGVAVRVPFVFSIKTGEMSVPERA